MCANDAMAIATIRQVTQQGLKVPDDISIIGFDDVEVASQINPALTTLAAPIAETAKLALDMLTSLMNGEETEAKHIALPAKLIIRNSCAEVKESAAA